MIAYKWQKWHTDSSGVVFWSSPIVYVRLSVLIKQEFLALPSLMLFLLTYEEAGIEVLLSLSVHKCTKCCLIENWIIQLSFPHNCPSGSAAFSLAGSILCHLGVSLEWLHCFVVVLFFWCHTEKIKRRAAVDGHVLLKAWNLYVVKGQKWIPKLLSSIKRG